MKVLKLTLKKRWFDAHLYGGKDHEYREIKKYWNDRLNPLNHYDAVEFTNGYGRYLPRFTKLLKDITIGIGNPEWCAPKDKQVYILNCGEIISKSNIDTNKHKSHVTRSSDSSLYDEVCIKCGATDISGAGWGELLKPCTK